MVAMTHVMTRTMALLVDARARVLVEALHDVLFLSSMLVASVQVSFPRRSVRRTVTASPLRSKESPASISPFPLSSSPLAASPSASLDPRAQHDGLVLDGQDDAPLVHQAVAVVVDAVVGDLVEGGPVDASSVRSTRPGRSRREGVSANPSRLAASATRSSAMIRSSARLVRVRRSERRLPDS